MFSGITEDEGRLANTPRDLIAGVYTEKYLAKFVSPNGDRAIYYRMFTRDGNLEPSVIDVIILEVETGKVSFCDYIEMPGGVWQCSDGRTGPDLADLITENEVENYCLAGHAGECGEHGDVIEVTRATP